MRNSIMISYVFKGLSLIIIDIITMMLVFSVWAIVNIPVFPMAISFIFLSLITLNAVIALSSRIIDEFGMSVFITAISSCVVYYIFIMIFTGITYIAISPKWYIICMLLASLFFIAINSGFIIANNSNNKEKEIMLDIKLIMLNATNALSTCRNLVEEKEYVNLKVSIDRAFERINSSTPFGRTNLSEVIFKEKQIADRITEANILLSDNDNKIDTASIISIFDDVYNLTTNREKLLIK